MAMLCNDLVALGYAQEDIGSEQSLAREIAVPKVSTRSFYLQALNYPKTKTEIFDVNRLCSNFFIPGFSPEMAWPGPGGDEHRSGLS
jgi:hypothetical protein